MNEMRSIKRERPLNLENARHDGHDEGMRGAETGGSPER
jgi:hypothetical protein